MIHVYKYNNTYIIIQKKQCVCFPDCPDCGVSLNPLSLTRIQYPMKCYHLLCTLEFGERTFYIAWHITFITGRWDHFFLLVGPFSWCFLYLNSPKHKFYFNFLIIFHSSIFIFTFFVIIEKIPRSFLFTFFTKKCERTIIVKSCIENALNRVS